MTKEAAGKPDDRVPVPHFNRTEHCRRIANAGGRRTYEVHGAAHMSAIGRRGFATSVALGWGLQLAVKLASSYHAKFGRAITLSAASKRKAAIRAAARRFYRGLPCDRCDAPCGEVHHLEINGADPNNGGYILILCSACHRREHRAQRLANLPRGSVQ